MQHHPPGTRFYTYKKDVPLKHGEYLGYDPKHGYFAHPPTSKSTRFDAKRKPPKKIVVKAKLAKAKIKHKVALTKKQKLKAQYQMVVAFGLWAIAHANQIHYAQIRPIPQVKKGRLPHLPLTTDCSGIATMAYQYAGLPDPNHDDGRFDGSGFTGTIRAYGQPDKSLPGRIGVFGEGSGHHAVINLDGGVDPWLCSHGSEVGPLHIKLSVEQRYQPRPINWYH